MSSFYTTVPAYEEGLLPVNLFNTECPESQKPVFQWLSFIYYKIRLSFIVLYINQAKHSRLYSIAFDISLVSIAFYSVCIFLLVTGRAVTES